MSQKFKSEVELQALNAATTDTDKFLVSDGGIIKFRTGAEMLSDLGVNAGAPASSIQHQVKAAVAINKGQAVYVSSADGTNMIVSLASNATEATSSKTMGLLVDTVAINGFANVIAEGLLAGLNTSTATAGAPVWLGTGGNLIYGLINKPYAPAHLVFIGIVTRVNANNGEIFVKVQNGFELDELHDVDLKSLTPVSGHLLGFNGNLWINKTIAGWLGYTPQDASTAITTSNIASQSVSNADYIDGVDSSRIVYGDGARASSNSGNMNDPNQKSGFHFAYGPTGAPYTEWWNWITIAGNSWQSSNNYEFQLAHDFHGDGFYVRRMTAGTAASWRQLVDSGNINTFVTSTSHTHTFDSLTSKSSGTGTYETSGDFRAPIFYDSNDTGYYVNPNLTSRIESVWVRGASATDGKVSIGGASYNSAMNINYDQIWTAAGNLHLQYSSGGNIDMNAGGGHTFSRTSLRAPIFYDYDDTAYYTNPASTSNLVSTYIGGHYYGSSNSSNILIRTAGSSAEMGIVGQNNSGAFRFQLYGNGGEYGFLNGEWASWDLRKVTNGNMYLNNQNSYYYGTDTAYLLRVYGTTDMRSPIYYDLDNTAYYVNPNGTSSLSLVIADNTIKSRKAQADGDYTTAALWTESYSTTTTGIAFHISGTVGKFLEMRTNGVLYWDNGTVWHSGNDGSGSGLDADTVDGIDSSRIIYGDNATGTLSISNATLDGVLKSGFYTVGTGGIPNATSVNFVMHTSYAGLSNQAGFDLACNDSTTSSFYLRPSTGGGKGAWQTIVTSSNIGSYAPTLTGGGASGTWGINITGSAGSAPNGSNINNYYDTTAGDGYGFRFWNGSDAYKISMGASSLYTYGPVSSYSIKTQMNDADTTRGFTWGRISYAPIAALNSTSGDMQIAGSFTAVTDSRAPIFYDTNNTGFYMDPTGTSNITKLYHSDNIVATNYGYGQVGLYSAVRYQAVFSMGESYMLPADGTSIGNLYGMAWSHPNAGGVAGNLNTHGLLVTENGSFLAAISGSIRSRDDMRAPIFYDSNNTGYYVDPAGTSNFYDLNISGTSHKYLYINPGNGYEAMVRYNGGSGSSWFVGKRTSNDLVTTADFHLYSQAAGITVAGVDVSGNFYATQSFRAGVFYDSDNTSYYVNPNYTSNLLGLTVTNTISGSITGNADTVDGYHASDIVLYKSQTVDMSNTGVFSASNYYPVTIPVGQVTPVTIEIQNNLNSNAPSWSTHGGGFTLNLKWVTNGSGWGTTEVKRKVFQHHERFANQTICGGITQMTNASVEVVWLRGGGTYYFKFSRDMTATANSVTYTAAGQSVSPTASAQNTVWNSAAGYENYYVNNLFVSENTYSPIYYDSSDTAYYVDPANTVFSANFAGKVQVNYGGASASTMIQTTGSYGTMAINTFYGSMYTSGNFYIGNPGGTAADLYGNNANFNIFYDRNNTGYYVDAASTSNLNTIQFSTLRSPIGDWVLGYQGGTTYSFGSVSAADTLNVDFNTTNFANSCTWFGGYGPGSGPGLAFENMASFARMAFWGLDFYDWNHGIQMTIDNGYVSANNSFRAPIFYDSNNTAYYFDGSSTGDSIRVAGDIVAYYSDDRLKDRKGNIENAIEKVLSLNGFYYEANQKAQELGYKKKMEVGVSAQEVEAILPELIKDAPIGQGYKTLDYGRLTPLLIEAIKEQQKQIEELKELVNKLITK